MKLRWLATIPLGAGVLFAALPFYLPALFATKGVTVGSAGWCPAGLCLHEITRGEDTVAGVEIGWERRVRVVGARVGLPKGGNSDGGGSEERTSGGGPSGGGPSDGGSSDGGASEGISAEGNSGESGGTPAIPSWITAVDVEDLQIRGLPLPALSGSIFPERHLEGDGVKVDGDVVHLTRETPFGLLQADVRREGNALLVAAALEEARFSHPSLGPDPLVLSSVKVDGSYEGGHFAGEVGVGGVSATVTLDRQGNGLTGTFSLPETPLGDVFRLLSSVVPEGKRAKIRGTVSASGSFSGPGLLDGDTSGLVFSLDPLVEDPWVDGLVSSAYRQGTFSYLARDAKGEKVKVESGDGTARWVPLADVGTLLPAAVIAAEDGAFYSHRGFDLPGMLLAAEENEAAGEIKRGGSTLTQQLAKNLFLDGERTYSRKLREILYAIELERELGKGRIMELYINVVEWGPAVRGVAVASRLFFLKAPVGLLPEEAAWMAGSLPSPRRAWEKQYLPGKPDLRRVEQVLGNMRLLTPDERAAAVARGVHFVPPSGSF